MIYDIDGNAIESGSFGLTGYTMVSEPIWEQGNAIIANSTNASCGESQAVDSTLKASDFIPVHGGNALFVTMVNVNLSSPAAYGFCFYDKDKNVLKNHTTTAFYGRTGTDARTKTVEVFVPQTAEYFRTTYWSDSYIASNPDVPAFTYTFTAGLFSSSEDGITLEMPPNRGMLNVIRRARQLTDIVWTPLVDIPRYCLIAGDYSGEADVHFLDWFKSGKTYKGIPYSGSGEPDINTGQINRNYLAGKWGREKLWAGLVTDFETFVTAARYSNSIMGLRQDRTTYDYDSSPYGIVCNALIWYCVGGTGRVPPLTQIINTIKCDQITNSVGTMDVNNVRLCDILWTSPHIAIITDIARDDSGEVVGIEVSEATTVGNSNNAIDDGQTNLGGIARRKFWTVDGFKTWFKLYTLNRPKHLANVSYQKSEYVDTGNEGDAKKIIDLPCVPYLGNKAVYKVGYIENSIILIGATGFNTLVVKKDGSEFNRFTITGLTEVEVGFSAAGSYSAYLLDSSNHKTMSCEWTVE